MMAMDSVGDVGFGTASLFHRAELQGLRMLVDVILLLPFRCVFFDSSR